MLKNFQKLESHAVAICKGKSKTNALDKGFHIAFRSDILAFMAMEYLYEEIMKKVLLLLANGFEAYEASCFTDIIGFAKNGGISVDLESVGLHEKLTCAFGFSVIPDKLLQEITVDAYDALAIPGGTSKSRFYEDASAEEFLETIRKFHRAKKPIAAICTGGIPLARAGVLEGHLGTTFPGKRQQEMLSYNVIVLNQDLVIDKNIITSSSPKTGIEVTFKLLEMLIPERNFADIRKFFQ